MYRKIIALLQAATDNESYTRVHTTRAHHACQNKAHQSTWVMQLMLPLWLAAREWGVAAAPRKVRRQETSSSVSTRKLGMPNEERPDSDLHNGKSSVNIRFEHGERL